MKVCDKCHKQIESGNKVDILKYKAELCDECASKIIQWIKTPIKQGFLMGLIKQ